MARDSAVFLSLFICSLLLLAPISSQQMAPAPAPVDSWCIAQRKASMKMLQYALDWACGPGQADCTAIQPGGSCFLPDNSHAHASYAFNAFYQKNHRGAGTCNFTFMATVVYKDPSYPPCYYPKVMP